MEHAKGKWIAFCDADDVDELYAIQRGCLKWLGNETIREKGQYAPNPAANLDRNIEAIGVTF